MVSPYSRQSNVYISSRRRADISPHLLPCHTVVFLSKRYRAGLTNRFPPPKAKPRILSIPNQQLAFRIRRQGSGQYDIGSTACTTSAPPALDTLSRLNTPFSNRLHGYPISPRYRCQFGGPYSDSCDVLGSDAFESGPRRRSGNPDTMSAHCRPAASKGQSSFINETVGFCRARNAMEAMTLKRPLH